MKYKDLSIYRDKDEEAFCVGWVGNGEGMNIGSVSPVVLDRIFERCKDSVIEHHRSAMPCQLCFPDMASYREATFEGKDTNKYAVHSETKESLCLGTADLLIDCNGKKYYCPDLIWHYIKVHGYQPPEEFMKALMSDCLDSN